MSEAWKVVLLAIMQRITEFLPVSSTGHWVIAQRERFHNMDSPGVFLGVALHAVVLAVAMTRTGIAIAASSPAIIWRLVTSSSCCAVKRWTAGCMVRFLPADDCQT